jgi:hypothetical protein
LRLSVFGGGFGLYGYLPAALTLEWEVATLTKYKPLIEKRPELTKYIKKIEFYESESQLLKISDGVAFARNPESQYSFIKTNLEHLRKKKHVFLEKPLSDSIENSNFLLENLSRNRVKYSLGYLFIHTDWYEMMLQNRDSNFFIHWKIPVVESSWKSDNLKGGGLANFYLVHLVPVMIGLGFSIQRAKIHLEKDRISIICENQNRIEILAELNSSDFSFKIWGDDKSKKIFIAETPFGARPRAGQVDPRIEALRRYLSLAIQNEDLANQSQDIELAVLDFLHFCNS